jgi:hypothetical protein
MVRSFQSLVLAAALLVGSAAQAAPTQKVTDLATFLTSTVEGKKFKSESHGVTPSGVRFDFWRTITYNAIRVGDTVSYQLNWSIKQDNYDPLPDGTFAAVPVSKDRFGFSRCELAEMKSTGLLQGFCMVAASSSGTSLNVDRVVATLVDGRLTLVAETVGYGDAFASGGSFSPGRVGKTTEFYKDDAGRTVSREVVKGWTVDPQTLEPVGDVVTYPEEIVVGE